MLVNIIGTISMAFFLGCFISYVINGKNKKADYMFVTMFIAPIALMLLTSVTLKACDLEYEYEQAKHAQWKYERENGLPYTSFSGE